MRQEYVSRSAAETVEVGRRLGRRVRGGDVVLLFGPLGAGKTQFVRGLAGALGVPSEEISSPSYTLVNEHEGRLRFYHVDLYRLAPGSLGDLGLEELFAEDSVVAVEWSERLEEAGWDLGDSTFVDIEYHPEEPGSRIVTVDEADAARV